jgi:prevent-host-death family protein
MKPIEIGSFEAKNRLSELLAQAEKGQKIYITRRGRRVAILSPPDADEAGARKSLSSLIKEIRTFRSHAKPGPEPLKRLIEEGRR